MTPKPTPKPTPNTPKPTLAELQRSLDAALLSGADTRSIRKAIRESTPPEPEPMPEAPPPPNPRATQLHADALQTIQAILDLFPLPETMTC
jgi:hypothetical protein